MRTSRMPQPPPRKKRKFANLIVVIVILGIAAYFISAGAAGEWIARNVVDPIMDTSISNAAEQSETTTEATSVAMQEDADTSTTVSPTETTSRTESNISADKLTLYTLQIGAFSGEGNAQIAANEIKSQGGAGFIAYDGSLYRVLVSGYLSEADAESVKQTLAEEGVQVSIFKLETGTLEFKIGAEQSQIEAVSACFDIVPETVYTLQQIIFSADSGDDTGTQIASLKENVQNTVDQLQASISENESAMQQLSEYMLSFNTALQALPEVGNTSEVEFSSELKYNLISTVVDYSAFLDEIGG